MNLSLPEILPVSTRPRLLEGAFAVLDLRLHLLMKSHVGRHPRALGHQHLPCRIHEASCSATKERPMSISCMPHAHVPYLAESAQAPSFHQGHVPGASCAPHLEHRLLRRFELCCPVFSRSPSAVEALEFRPEVFPVAPGFLSHCAKLVVLMSALCAVGALTKLHQTSLEDPAIVHRHPSKPAGSGTERSQRER